MLNEAQLRRSVQVLDILNRRWNPTHGWLKKRCCKSSLQRELPGAKLTTRRRRMFYARLSTLLQATLTLNESNAAENQQTFIVLCFLQHWGLVPWRDWYSRTGVLISPASQPKTKKLASV